MKRRYSAAEIQTFIAGGGGAILVALGIAILFILYLARPEEAAIHQKAVYFAAVSLHGLIPALGCAILYTAWKNQPASHCSAGC